MAAVHSAQSLNPPMNEKYDLHQISSGKYDAKTVHTTRKWGQRWLIPHLHPCLHAFGGQMDAVFTAVGIVPNFPVVCNFSIIFAPSKFDEILFSVH